MTSEEEAYKNSPAPPKRKSRSTCVEPHAGLEINRLPQELEHLTSLQSLNLADCVHLSGDLTGVVQFPFLMEVAPQEEVGLAFCQCSLSILSCWSASYRIDWIFDSRHRQDPSGASLTARRRQNCLDRSSSRELKWRNRRISHGGASSERLWLRARRWPPAVSPRQALPRPGPRIPRPDGAGRQTSW